MDTTKTTLPTSATTTNMGAKQHTNNAHTAPTHTKERERVARLHDTPLHPLA
jgi:hypothetical protein